MRELDAFHFSYAIKFIQITVHKSNVLQFMLIHTNTRYKSLMISGMGEDHFSSWEEWAVKKTDMGIICYLLYITTSNRY